MPADADPCVLRVSHDQAHVQRSTENCMKRELLILLFTLTTFGCASTSEPETWRYSYRIEGVPHDQGCTLASSTDHAVVRLESDQECTDNPGWCHPCQDGTPGLCPDLSAPGMYVDVYALGDIDPHGYVVIEACR